MKDDIGICNLALIRLGVTKKIETLENPKTVEAIAFAEVFEAVRERVLVDIAPRFARVYASLQKTGSTPFRWLYRYEYPNNCLDIRGIYPPRPAGSTAESFRRWLKECRTAYEIEMNEEDGSRSIVTDQDLAVIEYTSLVKNSMIYDEKFRSLFAWGLAAEVGLPMAKTPDFFKNAIAMYDKEKREVAAKLMNEEGKDQQPESEFVLARNS